MELFFLSESVRWAWSQVDKDGNGIASQKDLYRLLKKYNEHVRTSANIIQLVQKFDRNKDKILDCDELHQLLSVT